MPKVLLNTVILKLNTVQGIIKYCNTFVSKVLLNAVIAPKQQGQCCGFSIPNSSTQLMGYPRFPGLCSVSCEPDGAAG